MHGCESGKGKSRSYTTGYISQVHRPSKADIGQFLAPSPPKPDAAVQNQFSFYKIESPGFVPSRIYQGMQSSGKRQMGAAPIRTR